ncbi:hypothetical protein EMCRGX_G002459 [Ephydatia muelleri]
MVVHVQCNTLSISLWNELGPPATQNGILQNSYRPIPGPVQKAVFMQSSSFTAIASIQNVGRALRTLRILRVGLELRLAAAVAVMYSRGFKNCRDVLEPLQPSRYRFPTAVVYSCEQYDQAGRNCNTSPVAGDSSLICGPFDDT